MQRYVRLYGTRSERLLADARSMAALGPCFGYDLYQLEVDFLVRDEWASTADDILWRRTKLGLRLSAQERREHDEYLQGIRKESDAAVLNQWIVLT
ncbi:glycerol-3-phosphate dehydrogenase C-terminal domain-containing protein [Bradyrhizobium elkanii]|uniref:glycerol-3-phosphate dehydrogenase C-terminal domain-containing protein n=1 Tax=Bradyrhizobium elkanii TaxID=29448 RepID=UPI001FF03A62|nr:glycerol-3-phosphate dehydrogenase C-terminal domain-containing protein [Bradyrhizobium elkanii]